MPYNPRKVFRRVGSRLTPTLPSSPRIMTPSPNSLFNNIFVSPVNIAKIQDASNLLVSQLEQNPCVNTPKRKFVHELTVRMVKMDSRLAILTNEKAKAEGVLAARKRRDSGKRGIFKGQHSIANKGTLTLVRNEENRIAEQRNKRVTKATNQLDLRVGISNVVAGDSDQVISMIETDLN